MDRMITDPNLWPHWPLLPLKRHTNENLELGYLVAGDGFKIYAGNVFSAKPNDPILQEFESADQLVAAGWKVD